MLKKINLFTLAIVLCSVCFSQQSPAKWSFRTNKINDSVADLIMQCNLPDGWHIYSQKTKGTELPIEFTFQPSAQYQRLGGVQEPPYKAKYDKFAKDTTRYFENTAVFHQKIKVKIDKDFKVKGSVNFQLCENGSCIPPDDVEYTFDVKGNPNITAAVDETTEETPTQTAVTEPLPNAETATEVIDQAKSMGDTQDLADKSLLTVFLISFGVGLITLLTP